MNRLRRYFLSGLVVLLPIGLTFYILAALLQFADSLLGKYIQPILEKHLGFHIPGLGVVLLIIFIVVLGMVVSNFIGRAVHDFIEKIVLKMPIVSKVYPALKEMAQIFFAGKKKTAFRKAVLVEYPRKGLYSLGFLTNENVAKIEESTNKEEICVIFIPSAPSPLTGFLIMVPKKDVVFPDISVEQAIRVIVSGGVVNPD